MYQFLDGELPNQYYKDLVYELHNDLKGFQLDTDRQPSFEEESKLKQELKLATGKLQVYERLFILMLGVLIVLCVVIGLLCST